MTGRLYETGPKIFDLCPINIRTTRKTRELQIKKKKSGLFFFVQHFLLLTEPDHLIQSQPQIGVY